MKTQRSQKYINKIKLFKKKLMESTMNENEDYKPVL